MHSKPFSDVINFTNTTFAKADIHIISILGQNSDGMVYWNSAKPNEQEARFLPKGLYIMTLQNQANLLVKD